jgi:hypothetical protein
MRIRDITALGRPIDPRYPTNLAIAVLSVVVAIAGAIWRLISGAALLESAQWGIGAGFVLFLTWALGRELDPDHDLSAFVGAGLAIIALLLFDMPSLLLILWLLLLLRLVNRTVGLPAKPLDSLAILGLGAWLTWQGYWVVGLMTAAAFLLDGLLSPPLRYHLVAAGLALVTTVLLSIFRGNMAMVSGPTTPVVVSSVVIAGLFLVVIATSRELHAVADATGKPLNRRRVQAAQVLALLTALLFAWWAGISGMVALLPLWGAMAGVGLYRLAVLFRLRGP